MNTTLAGTHISREARTAQRASLTSSPRPLLESVGLACLRRSLKLNTPVLLREGFLEHRSASQTYPALEIPVSGLALTEKFVSFCSADPSEREQFKMRLSGDFERDFFDFFSMAVLGKWEAMKHRRNPLEKTFERMIAETCTPIFIDRIFRQIAYTNAVELRRDIELKITTSRDL